MREILFRGKRVDNGEWVEGYYYKAKFYRDDTELCDYITIPHPSENGRGNEHFMVLPETVGQYTGLTDKNGKKIFEGDIVKILYTDWISQPLEDTRSLEEYLDSLTEKGVVDFAPYVGWYLKNGKYDLSIISGTHGYIEVIGNIHDNPELIGGGEDA